MMHSTSGIPRVQTVTDLSEDYFASVSDWHIKMQGWSASEALMLMQKRRREARCALRV